MSSHDALPPNLTLLQLRDRIDALDHATLRHRPRLGAADLPPMVWGALRMRPARDGTIRADT